MLKLSRKTLPFLTWAFLLAWLPVLYAGSPSRQTFLTRINPSAPLVAAYDGWVQPGGKSPAPAKSNPLGDLISPPQLDDDVGRTIPLAEEEECSEHGIPPSPVLAREYGEPSRRADHGPPPPRRVDLDPSKPPPKT
jgi:hypothetical protein